ncbi:MFS transporter [Pseudarthrobacter sp. NamE5]|uniref:MFS transporter n=1 Tax=Pseudarthrobacter sp. NamE5 TaxID=2576839 RepID=UPI00110C1A13|nr:MFS transporter [Pseudarthrobacter sp. NamE5]TLM80934.1 MFS transporter [Pseudarthrobacter sp. NamE5]
MLIKQMRSYFSVNAAQNFGRVLPQAVLTPVLVGKGLDFSEIILVQIAFTISTLLLEFPCGLLADKTSKTFVYLCSIGLILCSYLIVYFSTGFWMMCVAWAVYGASAAAQSSTLDYYFAERLRSDTRALKRFYSTDQNVMLVTSICAALSSTVLYNLFGDAIYLLSLVFFALSILLGIVLLPRDTRPQDDKSEQEQEHKGFRNEIWQGLRLASRDSRIVSAIALLAITEFAVNPFFHLWQMVLLDSDFTPATFGLFFIAFQVVNVLANYIFSRFHRHQWHNLVALGCLFLIGLVSALADDAVLLAATLLVLPMPLFIYLGSLHTTLQSAIPSQVMSTVGSLSGTVTAVVGLVSLGICSTMMTYLSPQLTMGISLIFFSVVSVGLMRRFSFKRAAVAVQPGPVSSDVVD